MNTITLTPVGVVHNARRDASDAGWDDVVSTIHLDAAFDSTALRGLEEFSHVEIVFFFDKVPLASVVYGARHPRDDVRWPMLGIFAQRGAARPNRLGVSRAQLVAVHDRSIEVRGLDAIDGTPVVDIKPYMREFGVRGEVRQPGWCGEVMAGYY